MNVKASRSSGLSAHAVWNTVSDHEGMSSWAPGVKVTMERAGDSQPGGVGAIRRVVTVGPIIREEVTKFEPGRLLAYRALSGLPLPDYRGEVRITQRSSGCSVAWELSTSSRSSLAGPPLWILSRLFLAALLRAARRNTRGGRS